MQHDAIVRLLLKHRALFLAQIVSVVRDFHRAEDIYQDISVLVLDKAAELNDETHFRRWMHKAAKHKALSAVEKESRTSQLDASVLELLDAQWQQEQPAPLADVLESLRHCVQKLSPRSQRIVELRYGQGLTGQKLGDLVGQKVNSVYVTLSRIHQTLNKCVEQHRLSQQV